MANPHLCDNPNCGLCAPIKLRERLARGEKASSMVAGLIESLSADPDGVTDNDLLIMDLESILNTLHGDD